MAFMAKDGKKSTNRAPMMAHNRSLSRMEGRSEGGGVSTADPLAQPGDGGEMGNDDPGQVAQEHGPAEQVHMMHNHEAGEHHVHSMHPDGHEHHSMHGSVDEAHEHAKKLAGGGEHEEPDGDEQQPEFK